ncbi:SDR family NAD(P)-dependent oxidoreductase [Tessaracoccus sp. OS52]|uniref:SDR family NAD(P)-dependent oxidoreductase n=1 Tax=Tessaracoccus sp. OS52 TaxID=2886691 RepID=UPI001D1153CD|nr:SDR family NAD(P)-dependent oxidoreductase [Tessaracoccus sp. OS52]MCC2594103.1 SDR family NAD(P)-dependent oxidoreductase [Tessaracoccus sp. OS52]
MPTIAIIGAGSGLGAAVVRRFAKEGFAAALISRTADRVNALAEELRGEGIEARGYSANVRDHGALRAALDAAAADLGPIDVLQYSPLPAKEFLRPVLETTVDDLQPAIEFSVYGPLVAVHHVMQHMRFRGGGTVLLVNGGTAVQPLAKFAGTSVAFAGESALGAMLHDALAPDNIHVGQLIIPGGIIPGHPRKDPQVLAERLWTIHSERGEFRTFAGDMDLDG